MQIWVPKAACGMLKNCKRQGAVYELLAVSSDPGKPRVLAQIIEPRFDGPVHDLGDFLAEFLGGKGPGHADTLWGRPTQVKPMPPGLGPVGDACVSHTLL